MAGRCTLLVGARAEPPCMEHFFDELKLCKLMRSVELVGISPCEPRFATVRAVLGDWG